MNKVPNTHARVLAQPHTTPQPVGKEKRNGTCIIIIIATSCTVGMIPLTGYIIYMMIYIPLKPVLHF